jgi:hypothetical protein
MCEQVCLIENTRGPRKDLSTIRYAIEANSLSRLSHSASSSDLTAADFWLLRYLKVMLDGSSFETAEELQEKVTDILLSIATLTFRTVFEEWKSRLL